jgi:hypothetical protein
VFQASLPKKAAIRDEWLIYTLVQSLWQAPFALEPRSTSSSPTAGQVEEQASQQACRGDGIDDADPARVGVHGAGSRREDEERPHAHETGDEACEVEAPIEGGGQEKRTEQPEADGAVPHEDEQVRLVDGGAVAPLQRRASTDAHRREEMDDRDHHQERRHDVGHGVPPVGCQSTMNSVAPVVLEERCGSASSAT